MPALGGAAAQPLRFLDYLIYHPIRAVLLHGAGVLVNVPAPQRYAIHKLIVASRRLTDDDAWRRVARTSTGCHHNGSHDRNATDGGLGRRLPWKRTTVVQPGKRQFARA
ncbi:hypothetical protein F2981_18295 (plasmid) [Sinorhizobium meliloti]|nr:hypothetical protein [Sinorhizobium meliloti]